MMYMILYMEDPMARSSDITSFMLPEGDEPGL